MDFRSRVALVNIRQSLTLFKEELSRIWHNASLINVRTAWEWDMLARHAPAAAERICSQIKYEFPDAPCPDELFYFGRQGATLSTDCYLTMSRGWEKIDIAAEFDLPLSEQDMKDYSCRGYLEAWALIKGHHSVLKAINDKTREEVRRFEDGVYQP